MPPLNDDANTKDAPPMTHRVLCVGYGDAIMTSDAQDMTKAMKSLFGRTAASGTVTLLKGCKATQSTMQAALDVMLMVDKEQEKGCNDDKDSDTTEHTSRPTRVIYFSCHGIREDDGTLWLLTDNGRQDDTGSINATALRAACRQSPANVLLVLDRCYAGTVAQNNFGKLSQKWCSHVPGLVVLASSGPDRATHYQAGARNSPMPAVLLRTLRSLGCHGNRNSGGPMSA